MAGAYETGVYRNIFKECGYSEEEIEKRVKETFETIFYGSEEEYNEDRQENWGRLKRTLITSAAERALGNNTSEAFAYMKPDVAIAPENILDYVPAEKWRKDVLKYFGKE